MAEKNETKFEREYVIPLRRRFNIVPRYQKTNKAVKTVKEFLARHMQVRDRDLDKIKLDRYVNELLWSRGIKNPPSKIKVKAIKDGEIVRVELAELPTNIKFKKLREEKVENAAKEVAKKRKSEKVEEEKIEENKTEAEESKKEVEEEKKEAVVEAEQKIEKAEAREMKHTTKAKSPKEEKNDQKKYNKSSRGH